jgi:hypothetical protein
MDYSAILNEIDAELGRLIRVRAILADLAEPAIKKIRQPRKKQSVKKAVPALAAFVPDPMPPSPPKLTILPPKQSRKYERRVKPHVPELRAIGGTIPRGPVVVQKPDPAALAVSATSLPQAPHSLELLMRERLLDGSTAKRQAFA